MAKVAAVTTEVADADDTPAGNALDKFLTNSSGLADLRKIQTALFGLDLTEYVKFKTKGNQDIPFLSWYDVNHLLMTISPNFSFHVKEVLNVQGKVAVVGRLTLCVDAGNGDYTEVYREAIGTEDEDKDSFGDAFTNAQANAFKRAAAQFGLGLPLYSPKLREAYMHLAEGYKAQQSGRVMPGKVPPKVVAKAETKPTSQPKVETPADTKLADMTEGDKDKIVSSIRTKMTALGLAETAVIMSISQKFAEDAIFPSLEAGLDTLTAGQARTLYSSLDGMKKVH